MEAEKNYDQQINDALTKKLIEADISPYIKTYRVICIDENIQNRKIEYSVNYNAPMAKTDRIKELILKSMVQISTELGISAYQEVP
jgi:hypothetical protein